MKVPSVFGDDYVVETPRGNMTKLGEIARRVFGEAIGEPFEPTPARIESLRELHDPAYVDAFVLGESPLCRSNNLPWSQKLVRAVLAMNGGMLTAAEVALSRGIAVNIANGFHHALYSRGQAYCTFNGLAYLAARHPELNVFVLDLDQHGGNGTEDFTFRLENLTAFSIHGSPFGCRGGPRSHLRKLVGLTDDPAPLWHALDEAFDHARGCDLLVVQAGVDCHLDDPHGSMGLTAESLRVRDERVFRWARRQALPTVVTLAGGYQGWPRLIDLHLATFEVIAGIYR